jgi:hypothetical protein
MKLNIWHNQQYLITSLIVGATESKNIFGFLVLFGREGIRFIES